MKQGTIILMALLLSTTGFCQDSSRTDRRSSGEMQTLLGRGHAIGGYLGTTTRISELNDGYGMFSGGQLSLLVGHKFGIGVAGYGLVSGVSTNTIASDNEPYYYQMGYGGLQLEPVLFPDRLVHITLPVLIGFGGVSESLYHPYDYDFGYWDDYNEGESSGFFVVEPGANVQLNVTRWMHLDAGAYYRFIQSSNLSSSTDSDLSGLGGQISLKFGWF